MLTGCLSEQTIAQYVDAGLDAESSAHIEEHIDSCPSCRMALAEAARGRRISSESALSSTDPAVDSDPPLAPGVPPAPALLPGTQLGRYVVRRVVGGGAMGLVYAAYDPNLHREIALKLLRPELTGLSGCADERGLPDRLLREAQLMARLTHPNVVAVYDVGVLDGQVFVAMELVIGETLRRKLSGQTRRTWREVQALFLAAARGLWAAHREHVVHRDFKPDNVLVSQDGRVQVTDFGLARIRRSSDPLTEHPTPGAAVRVVEGDLTRTGAIVGTPAYMSPEQLRGEPADERSDQFAFCVALYEGLYGERPFSGSTVAALTQSIEKGPAPRDGRVPSWLRRVVLRGLRPDPDARWPSMEALISVLAHDPMERIWRWALMATSVTLLIAVGVMALRPRPASQTCRGAAERLHGVWDSARSEAVHRAFAATRVPYAEDAFSGVSRMLDAYARSWTAMHTEACEATWLRGEQSTELLDLRMGCLERQRQQLQARVALYETADAEAVRRAVSTAPAVVELRICADTKELLQPVRRPADPAAQAKITALEGRLSGLHARYQAGQYQAGIEDAQLAATESAALSYPPVEAEAELLLGDYQQAIGDLGTAESTFYRALWAGEAGKQDRAAVQAWTRLAHLVGFRQDRSAESQRLVQHAEATLRRLGGDDLERATLESAAGNIDFKTGRYDEALRRFAMSRALFEKTLGPDSLEEAEVLQRTAFALEPLSRFEEAIALERRSLAILTRRLGPEHPEVASAHLRLGEHLRLNEFYTPALTEMRQALPVYERLYPPDDIHVAEALYGLASVLTEIGQGAEALPLAARALQIRERRLGPGHSDVGEALAVHSDALLQTGKLDPALAEALRVQTILAQTLGISHVKYSFALLALGRIHSARHDYRRAIALHRESLQALERSQLTDVWSFSRPQLEIAKAQLALHEPAAAIPILEETLAKLDKFDPTSMFLADACFLLAQALASSGGDAQRATALAQRALALYRKVDLVREKERQAAERFLAGRAPVASPGAANSEQDPSKWPVP